MAVGDETQTGDGGMRFLEVARPEVDVEGGRGEGDEALDEFVTYASIRSCDNRVMLDACM